MQLEVMSTFERKLYAKANGVGRNLNKVRGSGAILENLLEYI